MKTILDFSKVPLDKWVDFYVAVSRCAMSLNVGGAFSDITKLATVMVKTEEDYNREIADFLHLLPLESLPSEINDLLFKRFELKQSELPATQPAEDVIK